MADKNCTVCHEPVKNHILVGKAQPVDPEDWHRVFYQAVPSDIWASRPRPRVVKHGGRVRLIPVARSANV